jgi:hypothetical protein
MSYYDILYILIICLDKLLTLKIHNNLNVRNKIT